jgi:hypothetical protein
MTIAEIIRDLRSLAQECKNAARDSVDEELSEYLTEMSVDLNAFADILSEYNQ